MKLTAVVLGAALCTLKCSGFAPSYGAVKVSRSAAFKMSSASAAGASSPQPSQPSPSSPDSDAAASTKAPTTFREAEVLGLRLMQERKHEEALRVFKDALKLPGSRPDVIRTKSWSGPSPVGGAFGGLESKNVMSLDEFEQQAAHYNIACASACLGKVKEAVASLQTAFSVGFDNYATVRADPDLSDIHDTPEFETLMKKYDPKLGFPNPFGSFFGGS